MRHRYLTGGDAARLVFELGGVESHSLSSRIADQYGCRNCVVVDVVGPSQDGSIIDLTSTGTQCVQGSDEEE